MNKLFLSLITVLALSFSTVSFAVDRAPVYVPEMEQPQHSEPTKEEVKKPQEKKSSRYSNMRRRLALMLIMRQPM